MKLLIKNVIAILFLIQFTIITKGQSESPIKINNDLQLIYLTDSVYIHISWFKSEKYGRFPSNGLVIIKNGKAILVDTPMDVVRTEELCSYLKDTMHVEVKKLIAAHFHKDCMGGMPYLKRIGIPTLANKLTYNKREELNYLLPEETFHEKLVLDFDGREIECRYFGAAHSFDNISVWLPEQKILFGGCMVKTIGAKNLGNLSDADTNEWHTTLNKVLQAYPNAATVIPGHGPYGDTTLLTHTVNLVHAYTNTMH